MPCLMRDYVPAVHSAPYRMVCVSQPLTPGTVSCSMDTVHSLDWVQKVGERALDHLRKLHDIVCFDKLDIFSTVKLTSFNGFIDFSSSPDAIYEVVVFLPPVCLLGSCFL